MAKSDVIAIDDRITTALAVCIGKYGTGNERKQALKDAGFSSAEISEIQSIVNGIFPVISKYL